MPVSHPKAFPRVQFMRSQKIFVFSGSPPRFLTPGEPSESRVRAGMGAVQDSRCRLPCFCKVNGVRFVTPSVIYFSAGSVESSSR